SPELENAFPFHNNCTVDHTRRGAWRGAFCGLGVIHGWENSWGPWAVLDRDQPGMAHLLQVRRFFKEIVPFQQLKPAPEIVIGQGSGVPPGYRPLGMGSVDLATIAAYLPAGGDVELALPQGDPRREY